MAIATCTLHIHSIPLPGLVNWSAFLPKRPIFPTNVLTERGYKLVDYSRCVVWHFCSKTLSTNLQRLKKYEQTSAKVDLSTSGRGVLAISLLMEL